MSESIIEPRSLDTLIRKAGRSRRWLAAAVGVHSQTIGKWCRKDRSMDATVIGMVARELLLSDAEELALQRWAAVRAEAAKGGQ